MTNLMSIIKVDFINLTGINKLTKEKSKKERARIIFVSLTILITIAILLSMGTKYFMEIGSILKVSQNLDMLLYLSCIISSGMIFFTCLYKAQGYLFNQRDFQNLMSLPIKSSTILLSKVLNLLLLNYIMEFFTVAPPVIVYFFYNGFEFLKFVIFIILFVFIPFIPMVLASSIAFIIGYISSKMKYKNFATIFISFIAIFLMMYFSMNINENSVMNVADLEVITGFMKNMYYPSKYFTLAIENINVVEALKFVLISSFIMYIFIFIFNKSFKKINSRFMETYKKENYKFENLNQSGVVKALIKKEAKRYFSSSVYVMNTIFGLVLITILSFGVLIFGSEILNKIFEFPLAKDMIAAFIIVIMSFSVVMTCTTASSISLESNNLWILKSSPIKITDIFKGKIGLNLILIVPVVIVNAIVFSLALKVSFVMFLWYLIIPILYGILIATLGLLINLYFPKLIWTSETVVVKQSLSTFLSIMMGIFLVIIPVGIYYFLKVQSIDIFLTILSIILLASIALIWGTLMDKGVELFNKL